MFDISTANSRIRENRISETRISVNSSNRKINLRLFSSFHFIKTLVLAQKTVIAQKRDATAFYANAGVYCTAL